jgi:hypothetical protein
MHLVGKRKSLDATRNQAVRDFVRAIVTDDFKGNVSAAAVAFDVSQSTLSEFLNGNRGAGINLIDAVATYRNVDLNVVLGRAATPWQSYPNKQHIRRAAEFLTAPDTVREAFDALETDDGADRSVIAWSLDFVRLMQAHAVVGDVGMRTGGGRRLRADALEGAQEHTPLLPARKI